MAHYFDSGFSYREPMWHKLENLVQVRPTSIDEAMQMASVDWLVEQRDIYDVHSFGTESYVEGDISPINGYKLNYRGDTGGHLGVVTDRYSVIQNRTMFEFMEELVDSKDEEVLWETAGALKGGKVIWALVELPQRRFQLPGTEEWNTVYVLVCTGHYTGFSFKASVTGVRVQCWNTLNMSLGSAPSIWSVNHTGDPLTRIQEAQETLGLAVDWSTAFSDLANDMANESLGIDGTKEFLGEMYPISDDDPGSVRTRVSKKRSTTFALIRSVGSRTPPIAWTKWAALQGVAEFADYKRPTRGTGTEDAQRRFWRAMVEPDNAEKARAVALLS